MKFLNTEVDTSASEYGQTYRQTRAELKKDIASKTFDEPHQDNRALASDLTKERAIYHGKIAVSYIHRCRACGFDLPRGCPSNHYEYVSPLSGRHVVEDPFPCPACGASPWDARATYDRAPAFKASVWDKPYWETGVSAEEARRAGLHKVKGKGTYVPDRAAADRLASVNGLSIRPEFR